MRRRPGLSLTLPQVEGKLHFLAEKNLNLEIQLSWESAENFPDNLLSKILAWKQSTGSQVTIHAPFIDMAPGGVDPLMRQATIMRFAQASVLAGRLQAQAIVVHPGYDEKRYWNDVDGFVARSVEMWTRVMGLTGEFGCSIALENIFEERPETLRRVVEGVGSPRFGICFDAGHFNMFSKVPLAEWLDALGGMIVELHLHNNYGEHDDHNGMVRGTFDFVPLFARLDEMGVDPILVMEPHKEEGIIESLKFMDSLAVLAKG
jgi:sugar phosphate isomerase/epimerase